MTKRIPKDQNYLTFSPDDTRLVSAFDQLGIKTRGIKQNKVYQSDFEKAKISYEFFRFFAELQKGVSETEKQNRHFEGDESALLTKALEIFDYNIFVDPKSMPKTLLLQDPDKVRDKINLLVKDPCWFQLASLELAIFGKISGKQKHYVAANLESKGTIGNRVTSAAKKFQCRFIPELAEHTRGLTYQPGKMPHDIQKAADSTALILSLKGLNQGSGVAAYRPGYLVTARHVIEKSIVQISRKQAYVPVVFRIAGNDFVGMAEVILVPSTPEDPKPDLAILYLAELIGKVQPLALAMGEAPQDPPLSKSNRRLATGRRSHISVEMWEREAASKLMEELVKKQTGLNIDFSPETYMLGYPHQSGEFELQVTIGERLGKNHDGLTVSNAPGLPGNSGGPMVDAQGKIIGIMSRLSTDSQIDAQIEKHQAHHSGPTVIHAEITGSSYYSMEDWGTSIKASIDRHRQRNRQPTPKQQRKIQEQLVYFLDRFKSLNPK